MSIWSKGIGSILGSLGNSVASEIQVEDLSVKDAIVAVMGPTGSGKSSFIEKATGVEGRVGHSLESCTSEISVVKLSFPELIDSDICFVDTPGFDDTNKSDVDIFKMISGWLNDTYKRKIQLTGLLYFHRISDNRMAGTPLKNLRLFERLCGDDFNRIVLTTTMWDDVDEETGSEREKELASVYWKSMIERGSSVRRFLNNRPSAFEILTPIINKVNKNSALLLQKEMMDLRLQLRQTTAGRTLFLELEELVDRHQRALSRIRGGLTESSFDEEQLQEVMEEYQKVSAQLQRAVEDMQRMKVSTGEWFKKLVIKKNWKRILGFFKGNARKASADPELRPNLTPDLMDASGSTHTLPSAGVVNSSGALMGATENPNGIQTIASPPEDSSTTRVMRKTDLSNHINGPVATPSADLILGSNPKPDLPSNIVDSSGPAQKLPAAEMVNSSNAFMKATKNPDCNQTLDSPRKNSSTTSQKSPVTENTDSSKHSSALVTKSIIDHNHNPGLPQEQRDSSPATTTPISNAITFPKISDDPPSDLLYKPFILPPAQSPSASKVGPGEHVDVTLKDIPDPTIEVDLTLGSSDLSNSNLEQKKLDVDSRNSYITESPEKLCSANTSRMVPYLSYSEDTSGSNLLDKVDSDILGAAGHSDSHNIGGHVDNTGTGSVSSDFSVVRVRDPKDETTYSSSSKKAKGDNFTFVGAFNRLVNSDDSSGNRRPRSSGKKKKKFFSAKVAHTANDQPLW